MAARKQKPKRKSSMSDRKLRENIARLYVSSELDGKVQVEAMALIFDWIKTGDTPSKQKLRVVANNTASGASA